MCRAKDRPGDLSLQSAYRGSVRRSCPSRCRVQSCLRTGPPAAVSGCRVRRSVPKDVYAFVAMRCVTRERSGGAGVELGGGGMNKPAWSRAAVISSACPFGALGASCAISVWSCCLRSNVVKPLSQRSKTLTAMAVVVADMGTCSKGIKMRSIASSFGAFLAV